MFPNDPQMALFQANTTMAERHRQAAHERLAAPSRSGDPGTLRARRDPPGWFRGLADLFRTALGRSYRSAADDKPRTAVSRST